MAVRFRRLFQFSLRSMLLLAVLVGLVCGVILIPAARSRRELPVIAQIEKRGGTAVRSFVPTPATEFAARFLGQEPFLRVTEVSLAESGATDADLLAIGRLGELRKLDLSHTYVTDDGLARLVSGLPELRVLDLTLANIGPRGLAALAGNANLEWVFTFGTATDYADLETLAKKLPGVPLVEQRARHEAEEFGYWVDERTFAPSLLSDPPDEQTVERMFDHLARIPDLWKLVWTEPDHAGLLVSRLGRLSSLRMLDLEGLASLDLDPIFDLPRLVELRISLSEDASGKSLPPPPARLGQLPRLRRLELSNVVAGDGLELLATLSGLRSLTIDSSDSSWGVHGVDLAPLGKLAALEELVLVGPSIEDDDLRQLAGLTSLRRLFLDGTRIRGRGLTHLSNCRNLSELVVSGTPFDDDGVATLAAFPLLESLDLSWTRVTDRGLGNLPDTVRRLTLYNTAVSTGACRALVQQRPQLTITLWFDRRRMTIEANSARANSSLPDVAEGTLRLQALAALFAGDYPRTAEAFLQAGAMPRGALGDYHRAAYALSLEGRWNEALAALNEGNRRALEEVRNPSPRTAPPGSDSFFGSSAYPPVRHLVGESLAAAGRLGLNALQDPRAARDAAAPVLALMAGDSASPGEESALRTLADVHEALGDNVAALRCLILARQSEVAERVEYARGGSKEDIGRLEDGEARPDSQRAPWAPDDPAIRLARAYAALVGHQPLPEVPVLGVVSADRPLVIDRWDEACWQFAWSKRGLNDFALVPPPGQAFAELSIVCEAPADGQVCPVSCWIGNRTDDWLESAQLAERTTGEWARGNSLVLDVPFDVPMVWLSLRGQADRAVVSARLRPSGQGRPAPPRVGGLAGFLQPLAGGSYTLDGEPLPTGMAFERVLPPGPHEFEFRGDDGQTRRRTLDIVSDATLPLFEHCENPFRPITLPLPAPRGRGNVGGSLARLPDGTRLLAYTTGERRQTRLVFACCPEKGRWSEPWAFAYDKVGPATRPTLLAHGGMVWMAYRAPLPAESWPHDGENLLWFCSTQDGKRWSRPQPVREASPSNGGWPGLTRLPDARLLLSGEDGFFSLADSPEQFHELDRLIAPLRGQHGDGIDSYEQRFAAVDSHGRMHVVVARAWKKGAESEDDEPEAYGLFYSYSDDLRHWAPLQLVQTTAPLFEPTSFALRGDRAAIVYDDDGRTWLWRGKLAENRLRMEPPVPIFNGFGAGPLICEGDKCSLVFTREGYVPCLLEADADDVFGKSSAVQP